MMLKSFFIVLSLFALSFATTSLSANKALYAQDQTPGHQHYLRAMEHGNKAYNANQYNEARDAYIQAVQQYPEQPDPYKNLARTYFWQENYAAATAYYDIYLRLYPQAEDAEQVRSERRLSFSRTSGQVWNIPDDQQLALKALQQELTEGRAFSKGGGGAWALYQSLLRMQYAQPELAEIKHRLLRRLLDEFEGSMLPPMNQLSPVLDMDDWDIQKARLEAIQTLANDELILDIVARRKKIIHAAEALLMERHNEAVELAQRAAQENPDILFIQWFHIAALMRLQEHDKALRVSEALVRRLTDTAPNQVDYARVVHASVLHNAGRHDDAAKIYLDILLK